MHAAGECDHVFVVCVHILYVGTKASRNLYHSHVPTPLPFDVELYSYSHGNNLGTLWYVWKVLGEQTLTNQSS